jgi:SAM-dependent methyltransferase
MAGADVIVCIVDNVDSEYRNEFEKLGASVRIVSRFSPVHPQSNKLRFLELPEIAAYDTVMLLDCDTIVVQDPSVYIDGQSLQARMAGYPTVPYEIFRELFSFFGLPLPSAEYRCAVSGTPTIWYVNTGVLIFPQRILRELFPVWRRYTDRLCENISLLKDAGNFCEQASLSLAFADHRVPFKNLRLAMNCPMPADSANIPDELRSCDPVIIHYHHQVDHAGLVVSNSFPFMRLRVNDFNERVKRERQRQFNNRSFWDYRYEMHPELGSGLGSRGPSLDLKRDLLKQVLAAVMPTSVLDIGCGDQFVTEDIPDDVYVGIDLSPVIIAKNRQKYPKRSYIIGDLMEENLAQFEMTICFDVVIHLDKEEVYRSFVNRLVNLTGAYGLISGFEKKPHFGSAITFFHEPLSQTLVLAGAKKIFHFGTYRETVIWFFLTGNSCPANLPDQLETRVHGGRLMTKVVSYFDKVCHRLKAMKWK